MMIHYSLTIPIRPEPKQRPGFTKFGKAYTPTKTRDYEKKISDYFTSHSRAGMFEKDVPIVVNLIFGMPIPKSTSKSKAKVMIEGAVKHTKKPDIDNMQKAVLDALNGIAWEDDSQIVKVTAEKEYAVKPYVHLYVHEAL